MNEDEAKAVSERVAELVRSREQALNELLATRSRLTACLNEIDRAIREFLPARTVSGRVHEGSIMSLVCSSMSDRENFTAKEAQEVLANNGRLVDQSLVRVLLSRASKPGSNGPIARVSHGLYRVRPKVATDD